MKVGDLVKYYGRWTMVGLVLKMNRAGGTIEVYHDGETKWWVRSGCEVVNESR